MLVRQSSGEANVLARAEYEKIEAFCVENFAFDRNHPAKVTTHLFRVPHRRRV
jgi:hypothetical protein